MNTRIEQLFLDHDVIAEGFDVLLDANWVEGFLIEARPPQAFIDNLPEGYHAYQIRHSDEDDSVPATLERGVFVNYYGTFITTEDLDWLFGNRTFKEIEDWGYIC